MSALPITAIVYVLALTPWIDFSGAELMTFTVGAALTLSVIRIVFDFSLVYYLIPGYFISLSLSLFVPPVYTGIAFSLPVSDVAGLAPKVLPKEESEA